jgi:hypothetical protein
MISGLTRIAASGDMLIFGVSHQDIAKLVPFFQELKKSGNGDIKEWGLTQTTLEEVFLKITQTNSQGQETIM